MFHYNIQFIRNHVLDYSCSRPFETSVHACFPHEERTEEIEEAE